MREGSRLSPSAKTSMGCLIVGAIAADWVKQHGLNLGARDEQASKGAAEDYRHSRLFTCRLDSVH